MAAGQRPSFPLRLQQILSGGRHTSPSLKLESEPPPKVKAFIDRVIKSPLDDIAIPLSGFRWEYNKGNFHHWRPLFLHFDAYFKTYLSSRKDLLLSDNLSENEHFPKHSVLEILRVMKIILENCHNKSSFGGLEHLRLLLASTDPEIVIATLETLSALVKINPSKIHVSGKLIGCGSMNSYLLSLAQGWGSKEEGLGLYSCIVANERNQPEGLTLFTSNVEKEFCGTDCRLGSTLHFEFSGATSHDLAQTGERSNASNLHIIHIPDLHVRKDDDIAILKQCVDQFNVPQEHRFSLLTRIRYAHALRSPRVCRLYSRICILAFVVLVQSSDAHEQLVSFFANEPEYTNELIRLVRSEDSVPVSLRALGMHALGAQLAAYASSHERARILSGSSIISAGGNRMVLLSVLQKAILSLSNSSDPSTPLFVDALLEFFLLHVLSSSSSGSVIRGSGLVPPLLPLLQDNDTSHMHLLCAAGKTLQKLFEYSSPAVSLFKDLGGLELLSQRLQIEVHRVITADESDTMVTGDNAKHDEDRLYAQKRLIKVLLKALGSATYSTANSTRSQNPHDNTLPASLSLIFHNASRFGGDIYFSAVTVMSEIIHKDPTCFPVLNEAGLPDAFLSSVKSGILPSSKALICVPNGLGAICLNNKGLEAVKDTSALHFLVDTFTSKKYLVAMNEGVVLLANAVEELLRHVSSLRSTGVDIIIEIISRLASLEESPKEVDESIAMETDIEEKAGEGNSLVSPMNSAADGISDEQFLHLCIFHVMVLVHRTMENSETCRLFVEKGGIDHLMKLLLQPSITQSSEGMPIALHSTIVFKGFTQHHSAPLAHAFSSSLRDHLKQALNGFTKASGQLVLSPGITADNELFASLFVIEFLLFLAASKDNRWISALLAAFGDVSKDVLEDIGRVHREVLWQLTLLEDSKRESDAEASGSANEAQGLDPGTSDSEEQRFNSFRQYLDPLLRRRVSGWSIESQFSDLINIYRDLGRAVSSPHRVGVDGYSTLRLASSSQSQLSNSSDGSVASRSEENKQRSYYSSCCDMMRSLSHHINNLFLELGKAMLLSSRRDNNPVNVSASVISVVTTIASIALDHLNFSAYAKFSKEVPISIKCRYLGKVIDFIDGILSDRPESCNPIVLNCFYGGGVIQTILTTFEATSQLLFQANRLPASPMDTDDKILKQDGKDDTDISWIYGPLASYGGLMDQLVTSSFILSSSTKQFLERSLVNGSIPFPQDSEAFVKVLQSKVLKAIFPIWTHPQFAECSLDFISSMISIMRHVLSGVEVRNVSAGSGTRISGPPPDESAISMIVEMGFSRARAEEALRQVGTNSVEVATDWLFSHPEEPQEDAELARALAMSLGNSDTSLKEDGATNSNKLDQEETVDLPSVDDMLSACIKLLQVKEQLAFPVRDLLVMLSSQNNGHYRSKVLTFIIDHIKHSCVISDPFNTSLLSSLFHVLALILHEDAVAREVASKAGFVKIALELLSQWNLEQPDGEKVEVPKCVTACLVSIDRLLQVDPKLTPEIIGLEQLKKDSASNQTSAMIDNNNGKELPSSLGSSASFLDNHDQKRLLEICCRCIKNQLPSETMHVVLQLCATLTKVHSVAVSFLDAGGLPALLNLPTSSLFPGYNTVAAAIIRHILEDPHTLQQAMELEIRHHLITATSRHSNARVTPRTFVQNLAFVIARDPAVFMRAAQAVCQIEMVGDRPYVVMLKERDKEKSKKNEKERVTEKEKQPACDEKGETGPVSHTVGHGKLPDLNAKSVKVHRKSPQSFTNVIEHLLDFVIRYTPPSKVDDQIESGPGMPSVVDMDIDSTSAKGKGKAIASSSEDSKTSNQEASASLAKTVFILRLLTEILLTYASSINILLRRDSEVSSFCGPMHGTSAKCNAGIFSHILHKFLPYPGTFKKDKKVDGDWRYKLSTRANQFLVASSIRSSEARKRIFSEISDVLNEFADSSNGWSTPDSHMHAFVDLLNDVLAARSPTGSYISAEASVTFIEAGLVRSLTRTLKVLDLDNADSSKIVSGIVKALESVTKEHVHSQDSSKVDNSSKLASDQTQQDISYNIGGRFHALETTSQPDPTEAVGGHMEPFNSGPTSGSSDSVTDDMDHDRDMDGGFSHEGDDFMHETEDGGENGISTVEITFDIPHNAEDNLRDEDEDMSGDDGDEAEEDDDEDDEEHNDLEEDDDVHQMSHPEMDQDDQEIDDEEFDEDMLEDDEDDDEDDGVILRLEEGINGMNVLDHIDVLSGGNNFSTETLRVMPLDIFGSRRPGRTTSIYNLLGRAGDSAGPLDHPLLEEPSSIRNLVHQRQTENAVDMAFTDRNPESASSRLDSIFRSFRSGRHGHRFSMWLDDGPQRIGSNAPAVPQGMEELIVSTLRRPATDEASELDRSTNHPQENDEPNQLHRSEAEAAEGTPAAGSGNNESMIIASPSSVRRGSGSASVGPVNADPLQERDVANQSEQVIDMQYERTDPTSRDVEAISQASSGSGATLGESLRSLEVEIGSVDGHDDGERPGPVDRLPLGDLQPTTRMRRQSGNPMQGSSRDASLESVSEVPPHPNQETDQDALNGEHQANGAVDSDSIDPTFLEALPEELRAEVLSSRQNHAAQPSAEQSQATGDIDPEFLAALPPDIREEVLAQQRAQRQQQSQELEGQPVEMDAVSIIATFPSEIREEVLLTSPDTLLATLTPALVAEANMLRERFAHRYNSGALFGMYSRNRRGESSRRGEMIGSNLDRTAASSRKSAAGKLIEADGAPLVDTDALKALIRLLRVVQPLYKGQFQRLLLNLCAHHETRTSLVRIFMDMLMLDLRGPVKSSLEDVEPPFRLYGCQSYIIYSRPQFSNGVPPLVSRRILETLTYLARNHPYVAKLLLHLELPRPDVSDMDASLQDRGKSIITMEEDKFEDKKGEFSIVLLISLLNQPLYTRSVAHLEQLLNLLEVIMVNTESDPAISTKPGGSSEKLSGADNAMQDADVTSNVVGSSTDAESKSLETQNGCSTSVSASTNEHSLRTILLSLPQTELRFLCTLLAREGLSDSAYVLVAEVLRKLVAVAPSFCHLFITELATSVQSLIVCAMSELHLFEDAEKALLSTSSTNGTAILRVVQALSSLVTTLREKEKDPHFSTEKDHTEALSQIWDINSTLESLWLELSNCISKIESSSEGTSDLSIVSGNSASTSVGATPPLPTGAQNILPYIESFFVTCEKLHPGQSDALQDFASTTPDVEEATASTSGQKSSGAYTKVDEKHLAFVKFSERHRKLLNAFIRQNPGLLEKSFSLMLKVPRFIDFDNKRAHFRSKIKHQHDHHHSPVRISVRRAYNLEDSYNQLRMRSPQDLKGRLTVHFQGEEGIDAGGLTREWYQLLSRVIFDKGALLFTTVGNESTFQPNPNSVYQTEHLSYFKFVGRVVGKALFDGQLLDVHFTRSFYKHILGVKVTYHDIEAIDPGYFKNLKWMLENDISDVLDLTFSMDADEEKRILYEKGEVTDCELIPGGRNIRVTEENKHEYVDRVAEHRLTTAIRPQINAFMEGFNELIPRDLISIFNDKELELLISGLPDIDLDDLRANTEYSGYSNGSPVIQWFWEVLQGFSKEDKARFLQFVTGTSKVPLEGFSALQGISGSQRFQIHKAYGSTDHLPSAHTCFNQLDLPEYISKEQLQKRLLLAIHEGNEGFGFG